MTGVDLADLWEVPDPATAPPVTDAVEPTLFAPEALREINALEVRIAAANADADAALWAQAGLVVRLLRSGVSQRAVARHWINLRSRKSYTHRHVQIVAQVAGYFNSQPRPSFRTVYNTIANAGSKRSHVKWSDLSDAERREVRRIAAEMDAFPFVRRTFFDPGPGRGGDLGVVPGTAGARVFWDLVGGDPEGGRQTFRYTRSEVAAKVHAFITKGVLSVVSNLAVDVARRRLAGDPSLSQPELPPSAADVAERSIWLTAESVAECETLAPLLGTRDISETAAAAIALVAQWAKRHDVEERTPPHGQDDDDLSECLRELPTPDDSEEFEEALP